MKNYNFLEDIIDHILPEHLDRIRSFETAGHIAHLNLSPEHESFAETIGQIIIDVKYLHFIYQLIPLIYLF